MLNVPVNSKGHVGRLPPFYGTFTQNEDVMKNKDLWMLLDGLRNKLNKLNKLGLRMRNKLNKLLDGLRNKLNEMV